MQRHDSTINILHIYSNNYFMISFDKVSEKFEYGSWNNETYPDIQCVKTVMVSLISPAHLTFMKIYVPLLLKF